MDNTLASETKTINDEEITNVQTGVTASTTAGDETVNNVVEPVAELETNQIQVAETKVANGDEFSYLKRNEFTSEVYKIEVRNLGYFGIGEFKKLLKNKLELDISKIKSPNRKDFAFVCFRSQMHQERALTILNGYKWKGKVLTASTAKASADPLMKRRNAEKQQQQTENVDKDNGGDDDDIPAKRARNSVEATCPLASMTYDDQLKQKTTQLEVILKKFTKDLFRINPKAKEPLKAFHFNGVEPSPIVNGYRNKNEFTVGKNALGEIVVGFRLGAYADGSVEVSEVQTLPHLPEAAKWAARTFQSYVRASKFQPFNPEVNSGHFRQLMVRTSMQTGELMLVAGIYSSNLTIDEIQELKTEMRDYYEQHQSENVDDGSQTETATQFKCTSLYYQDVKHREVGQTVSPVEHLSGTTHIRDTILGLEFRISPLAFFQINTGAASVLYQRAIDLARPTAHSTVLDICCGTGTIALAFAGHCKQVLGVEIIADAIKDAEFNAQMNGIENCKFFTGNADDYIESMVRQVVYDNAQGEMLDLIAVVDPPRAGLHNRSITAIRAASSIKRLIYIACKPQRAQKNFIELCRPQSKQYKGDPFYPKTAFAVDMFPHTMHIELVVLFERGNEESAAATVGESSTSVTTKVEPSIETLAEDGKEASI